MRIGVLVPIVIGLTAAGCGTSGGTSAPNPSASPSPANVSPVPDATSGTSPNPPGGTSSPTFTVNTRYARFVNSLCHDLATKNASGVINALPYYQYNNGLRWGMMGDGEGTTSDPSQMRTWLAASNVHCTYFTPGQDGHGTVLATGWAQPGPSALAELDIYPDGSWKINDFTFGSQGVLYNAMQTAGAPLRYRG